MFFDLGPENLGPDVSKHTKAKERGPERVCPYCRTAVLVCVRPRILVRKISPLILAVETWGFLHYTRNFEI